MDDMGAKKGPRKSCVPGGQRTRNRSGSDWTLRHLRRPRFRSGCRVGRWSKCPKRAACIHASGKALRGPQNSRRRGNPRCRPIHVDQLLNP